MLILNKNTLVPISATTLIAVAMFYFSMAYSKVEYQEVAIKENKTALTEIKKNVNENLMEILQRLARIEESLKSR